MYEHAISFTFVAKLLKNKIKMRKVFAFAAVAGLLTFAACGEKKAENTEATTETTVDSSAVEASPMDSTAVTTDSAGTTVVDSAAVAPAPAAH